MTIASTTSQVSYSGNGSTTVFSYGFKITDDDHLEIVIADSDDTQTTLTKTTHYTVSGVGEASGGDVTLLDLTAVVGAAALPTGYTLSIRRSVPLTQSTDLEDDDNFYASTHEDFFDKITMICQQQQEELDRCPKATVTSGDTGATIMSTIEGYSTAAASSASAASTSASNAASSAAAAAASASAASTSETNAATSETNAATSETNAATSETNAATSESNTNTYMGLTSAMTAAASDHKDAAETAETNAETAQALAEDWASKTDGIVDSTDYSSKEYAIGTQIRGASGGGSSKDWATRLGGTADDTDYSSKEYAIGETVTGGSAKNWATKAEDSIVAGSEYSAKHYAAKASASASAASTSETNAASSETNAATSESNAASYLAAANIPSSLSGEALKYLRVKSDESGYELAQSGGGGGTSLNWIDDASNTPIDELENGVRARHFGDGLGQTLPANFIVPSTYTAGQQIKLRCLIYGENNATDLLLSATTTLIRTGTDALDSTTNQHSSTNTTKTITTANVLEYIDIDLTDASGQINGVAVNASDLLKISLSRGTDTDTADLRFVQFATNIIIGG